MMIPNPTPIYRIVHIDNLANCLKRAALWAPNYNPNDGLLYCTIHNAMIQEKRAVRTIPCGPGGVAHDYLPFYFGYLSPMLLQLKTGQVEGYAEGQEPIIYLVTSAQAVARSGMEFVFSDGHGIAAFTEWSDNLAELNRVDWDMVYQRYWKDTEADPDRQRRKQAEFLIHRRCDWALIQGIAVINDTMKARVEEILGPFDTSLHRPVKVKRDWYYY